MEMEILLKITKQVLGISNNLRDEYLTSRIRATIDTLEKEKGVILDYDNHNHILFIADYTAFQYNAKGNDKDLPKNLLRRLKDLFFQSGIKSD